MIRLNDHVKYLGWFLVGNLLLVAIYFGLGVTGRLPPPPFAKSISFDEKVVWLHNHAKSTIDILALGSSMTLNNFNSAVVFNRYPRKRYVNASSWGMKFENIYEYFRFLNMSYDISALIVSCSIVDFRNDRTWQQIPNAGLLAYYLDGGSETLCEAVLFSGPYFVGNLKEIKYLRTRNDHYKSLRFDQGGGVPFAGNGFAVDPSRWQGKFLKDVVVEERNYAALVQLARYCRQQGIPFVLCTPPGRRKALGFLPEGLQDRHLSRLRTLADQEGFFLVEIGEDGFGDEMYVDWGHFNENGARRYTAAVIEQIEQGGIL